MSIWNRWQIRFKTNSWTIYTIRMIGCHSYLPFHVENINCWSWHFEPDGWNATVDDRVELILYCYVDMDDEDWQNTKWIRPLHRLQTDIVKKLNTNLDLESDLLELRIRNTMTLDCFRLTRCASRQTYQCRNWWEGGHHHCAIPDHRFYPAAPKDFQCTWPE